ncbi:hypothetical protein LI328DRAFT_122907 [Trichoderma asperelloides]|nr:hypothetical protein LI328DRAFT_122907 [Trichoderma asperelloides]
MTPAPRMGMARQPYPDRSPPRVVQLAKDHGSCPAGHGPPGLSSVISMAVSCPFSIPAAVLFSLFVVDRAEWLWCKRGSSLCLRALLVILRCLSVEFTMLSVMFCFTHIICLCQAAIV